MFTSRRHLPILIDTFEARGKKTKLAIQLAGAIPITPNSSLISTLGGSIIRTRWPLLIPAWKLTHSDEPPSSMTFPASLDLEPSIEPGQIYPGQHVWMGATPSTTPRI